MKQIAECLPNIPLQSKAYFRIFFYRTFQLSDVSTEFVFFRAQCPNWFPNLNHKSLVTTLHFCYFHLSLLLPTHKQTKTRKPHTEYTHLLVPEDDRPWEWSCLYFTISDFYFLRFFFIHLHGFITSISMTCLSLLRHRLLVGSRGGGMKLFIFTVPPCPQTCLVPCNAGCL